MPETQTHQANGVNQQREPLGPNGVTQQREPSGERLVASLNLRRRIP
jgi:hypothetical protein